MPWQCFCEENFDESDNYNPDSIWGLKYLIEIQLKKPGPWTSGGSESRQKSSEYGKTIKNTEITRVGIVYDNELIGVSGIINPPFNKYVRELSHSVNHIEYIRGDSPDDLKIFLNALECDILYLHCHADTDNENPQNSWIFDKRLTIDEIECSWELKELKGNPLVFLNACEAGQFNPMSSIGIVKMFNKMGARGVIGPLCTIPKSVAPEFARIFFKNFLDKNNAGISLLNAKKKFIYDYNNPISLAYNLYGSTNIILSRPASETNINIKCILLDRTKWPNSGDNSPISP